MAYSFFISSVFDCSLAGFFLTLMRPSTLTTTSSIPRTYLKCQSWAPPAHSYIDRQASFLALLEQSTSSFYLILCTWHHRQISSWIANLESIHHIEYSKLTKIKWANFRQQDDREKNVKMLVKCHVMLSTELWIIHSKLSNIFQNFLGSIYLLWL